MSVAVTAAAVAAISAVGRQTLHARTLEAGEEQLLEVQATAKAMSAVCGVVGYSSWRSCGCGGCVMGRASSSIVCARSTLAVVAAPASYQLVTSTEHGVDRHMHMGVASGCGMRVPPRSVLCHQ